MYIIYIEKNMSEVCKIENKEDIKIFSSEDIIKEKNTDLLVKCKLDKKKRKEFLKNPNNKELIEINPNFEILYKLPISNELRQKLFYDKDFF
jgi:hypothetical protein